MSVVNKMLRDLEDRKGDDAAVTADYQPAAKTSPKLKVAVLLILPFLAVAAWFYFSSQSEPAAPVLVTVPVQAETSQQQEPSESQSVEPKDSEATLQGSIEQVSSASESTAQQVQTEKALPEEKQPSLAMQSQKLAQEPVVAIAPPTETVLPSTPTLVANKDKGAETEPKGVLNIRSNYQDDSLAGLKQKAQLAVEQGDTRNSIKYLTQILTKEPDNINVRKKLAAMQFSQGSYTKAQSLLEDGMGRHPDSADLRLMLARLHVQRKDLQQAHQVLMAHPVNAAVNPDYVSYRASIASQLEDYQAAKEDYVHLINSQPSNGKWWLGLGVSEEKLNNQSAALLAYRQAQQFEQLTPQVQQFVQQRIRFLAGEQ